MGNKRRRRRRRRRKRKKRRKRRRRRKKRKKINLLVLRISREIHLIIRIQIQSITHQPYPSLVLQIHRECVYPSHGLFGGGGREGKERGGGCEISLPGEGEVAVMGGWE